MAGGNEAAIWYWSERFERNPSNRVQEVENVVPITLRLRYNIYMALIGTLTLSIFMRLRDAFPILFIKTIWCTFYARIK